MIICYLTNLSMFSSTMHFLGNGFSYKQLFYIFVMLNIVFLAVTIVLLVIGPVSGKTFFQTLFIILYFQAAFFIFHIVVSKIVDIVWLPTNANKDKVSLLGVFCGSIIYATKFAIIDKQLLHIVSKHGNKAPLIAVLVIMSFWAFFYFLFHIEIKYPLRKRKFFRRKKKSS